jgi:hypothetical protein
MTTAEQEQETKETSGSPAQPPRVDKSSPAATRRSEAEHMTREARELLRKVAEKTRKPSVGAAVAGAAVLAAGAIWGASEAAVAAVAAYAVFRMLRKRWQSSRDEDTLEDEEPERETASPGGHP